MKIILEGGNAAKKLAASKLSLHPDNQDRDLTYDKVFDEELTSVLPRKAGSFPSATDDTYVGSLLHALGKLGLLDTGYAPTFSLGSTRLAALKLYGAESVDVEQYETDDVIQIASGKKTSYGDLDIDVMFAADAKEILKALREIDPARYAAMGGRDEINVAIRIGSKVIQVDLVDVSRGFNDKSFLQGSSFIDMASDVKVAFQVLLLRSVVSLMDITGEGTIEDLLLYAEDNPNDDFSQELAGRIKNGWIPQGLRYVLGENGVRLILDLTKQQPNGNTSRTKIDIDPTARHSFEDFDELARIILQNSAADKSTIYSAIKLAEFVSKNFSSDSIEKLWHGLIAASAKNLKGKITEEDYNTGLSTIGNILGKQWSPEEEALNEGREAIGRFIGKNQFSNKDMFSLLRAMVKETGNEGQANFSIDLGSSPSVDLVEKMDSMFCHFGVNQEGKFVMESSNSGEVTSDNAEEAFGWNNDLFSSFKWLSSSREFQDSLRLIFESVGPFKYDAELFPTLTHEGDEEGNVFFVATPYQKSKLGTAGAFVVFKTQLWDPEEMLWYRPTPEQNMILVETIKRQAYADGWAQDWRVYTNEEDMKHNVSMSLQLGDKLTKYLSSDEAYREGYEVVTSRKKSDLKEELSFEMNRVREVLQNKLNQYASTASSVLGSKDSYIEGVVLRIKDSNGDIYEVKGTSPQFDSNKDKLWGDRVKVLNLEKTLDQKMMVDVLNLKTANPGVLNRAIKQLAADFQPKSEGADRRIEFIEALIPVISEPIENFAKIKPDAMALVREAEIALEEIERSFEENEKNLDPDSITKTREFIEASREKLKQYRSAVNNKLSGKSFYVYMIGLVVGRRIDRFVDFSQRDRAEKDTVKRQKTIIWTGRAQPWHKGHHAMVEKGKSLLEELGAANVTILIVKGGKSSQDKTKNPLSEKEQIALIKSIYEGDPQVVVHEKPLPGGFVASVAEEIYQAKVRVAGWLAGADRTADYRRQLNRFDPARWTADHSFSPFEKDEAGDSTTVMIETPRLMSGTESRKLVSELSVVDWIKAVAPDNISQNAVSAYADVYERLKNPELTEMIIKEMSGMGAGAVAGASGFADEDKESLIREEEEDEIEESFVAAGSGVATMKRDDEELFNSHDLTEEEEMISREEFMNEMKLRNHIRRSIRIVERKERRATLKEEMKLRALISKLIVEAEEDVPHENTGINMLEDLLKKVIPTLETNYKSLTTDKVQRDSFRAHIVNAVQNSLAPARAEFRASSEGDEGTPALKPQAGLEEQDLEVDVPNSEGEAQRKSDSRFIDIDGDKPQQPEVSPEDAFGIPGEDETGRNVALKAYDQIAKAIEDTYRVLSNPTDRNLFYDYLITNLKLYFDKFEEELGSSVQEPESTIYSQEKGQEQGPVGPDVGL